MNTPRHPDRELHAAVVGVAVFTLAKGGLMYEAAVAGQKFDYAPLLDGGK